MKESEIENIIDLQVKAKVADLSEWNEVRWEGGRLYFETTKIAREIRNYSIEYQILYLEKLLDYEFLVQDNLPDEAPDITLPFKNWLVKTISQLKIKLIQDSNKLNKKYSADFRLDGFGFDQIIVDTLHSRIEEIIKGINANSPLSVIFLSGSTLEGILLGIANKYPKTYNQTKSSPKQEDGKPKTLSQWTLSELINSTCEIGLIKEDSKLFSQVLRGFRNYIHPFEQIKFGFNPTIDTAELCWKVLQMVISQIEENRHVLTEKASA